MLRAAFLLLLVACKSGETVESPTKITDGLRVTFSVDLDRLIEETRHDLAARAAVTLRGAVAEVRVAGAVISVIPAKPDDRDEVVRLVARELGEQLEPQPCSSAGTSSGSGAASGPIAIPSLCFQLRPDFVKKAKRDAFAQTAGVITKRLTQVKVKTQVTGIGAEIVIDIEEPSLDESARVRDFAAWRAKLELQLVDHDAPFMHALVAKLASEPNEDITSDTDRWQSDRGPEQDAYLVAVKREVLVKYLADLASKEPRFAPPADREFGFQQIDHKWRTMYLQRGSEVEVGGRSVIDAQVDVDEGKPFVLVTLEKEAARNFEKLTSANIGKKLAIVVDRKVMSAPIINNMLRDRFAITMGDDAKRESADDLALMLRAGALPLAIREEKVAELRGGKLFEVGEDGVMREVKR